VAKHLLNGHWFTPDQLSEVSGIPAHTIRDRLRRGYTVEEAIKQLPVQESIKEFCEASYYQDWIGMPMSDLYEIFYKWCISNGHELVSKQAFTRHIMSMYPMLKIIPTKRGDKCYRIIRLRG
jgi:hypothetical protein